MHEVQNVYYGRDRGEKDSGYRVYKDEKDYLKNGFRSGEQFVYLMKLDGKKDYMDKPIGTWYYAESIYTDSGKYVNGDFKLLEETAIRDHIDTLKDSLKERKVA